MTCDRIRFGGSISGSTLSGGTVVEGTALALQDGHAGLIGHPGFRVQDQARLGMDGDWYLPDKSYNSRIMTLSIAAWDRDATGTITAAGGRCEELEDNIDTLLELLDGDGGRFIIERDMTDGTTRWIRAQVSGQVTATTGPVFGESTSAYTLIIPLRCPYPLWQSETQHSQAVSGADTIVNAGNARIANAILAFSGDGTFTNSDGDEDGASYDLVVSGSVATVTVDVGEATVTQSGSSADNLLTPDKPWWLRLGKGTTNVTSTVSVTVTYRDHWF